MTGHSLHNGSIHRRELTGRGGFSNSKIVFFHVAHLNVGNQESSQSSPRPTVLSTTASPCMSGYTAHVSITLQRIPTTQTLRQRSKKTVTDGRAGGGALVLVSDSGQCSWDVPTAQLSKQSCIECFRMKFFDSRE